MCIVISIKKFHRKISIASLNCYVLKFTRSLTRFHTGGQFWPRKRVILVKENNRLMREAISIKKFHRKISISSLNCYVLKFTRSLTHNHPAGQFWPRNRVILPKENNYFMRIAIYIKIFVFVNLIAIFIKRLLVQVQWFRSGEGPRDLQETPWEQHWRELGPAFVAFVHQGLNFPLHRKS